MKIKLLSFLACLYALNASAFEFYQDTIKPSDTIKVPEEVNTDTLSEVVESIVLDTIKLEPPMVVYWSKKNTLGVNLNEVAFFNWNSGGNNSISALLHGNFERNYSKDHMNWKNRASIRYGLNSQEGQRLRKSDDELSLNSSFGYRKNKKSNWFYSGKLEFRTQFADGYKYPDRDTPISRFMAPGYLFLGVGSEYNSPNEKLYTYISPLTLKSTFVLDQHLANEGNFGVEGAEYDEEGNLIKEGQSVRSEVGFIFTSDFSNEILKNVNLENRLSLYSDYLYNFGNIDIDWELNVNMKVNDLIRASIGTHLRYDDDVKFKEDRNEDGELETYGARVQFKQMLGVGVVYEF